MATIAAFFPPLARVDLAFRERLLAYARTLLDVPYEINLPGETKIPGSRGWGKQYPFPDKGLDCSGYALNVLQHMNLLLDLNPLFTDCDALSTHCVPISKAAAMPGDLVFFEHTFDSPSRLTHVGIVTAQGGTRMISAREPGVRFDDLPGSFADNAPQYGRVKGMPD
jgi:cell wall-associated NlpC family hydrolase